MRPALLIHLTGPSCCLSVSHRQSAAPATASASSVLLGLAQHQDGPATLPSYGHAGLGPERGPCGRSCAGHKRYPLRAAQRRPGAELLQDRRGWLQLHLQYVHAIQSLTGRIFESSESIHSPRAPHLVGCGPPLGVPLQVEVLSPLAMPQSLRLPGPQGD
jgi:hypothetical protein